MKNAQLKYLLDSIYTYIRPYRKRFFGAILSTVLYVAANAIVPFIVGLSITELTSSVARKVTGDLSAGVDFSYIGKIVITLIVLGIIVLVFEFFANFTLAAVIQDAMYDLRHDLNRKINALPISYIDAQHKGDLLGRITNDVDAVSGALQQTILKITMSVLSIFFSVIMMMIISVPMALISCLIVPAAFFSAQFFIKKSQAHFQKLQDSLGKMSGYTQENYTGFTVTKLYGMENKTKEEFMDINGTLQKNGFRANVLSGIIDPLFSFIINTCYIAMLIMGGYQVIGGIMTIGNLQAFLQYVWLITPSLSQISQLSGTIQSAVASFTRISEVMNAREEVPDGEPLVFNVENIRGDITFENVTFGYNSEKPLMKNLNVHVKAGQTVAVVGPTGAGKTTLINLLMRFYDPQEGCIKVDGIDTRDMTRAQLRGLFGMVLQDPWLFSGSIVDNIRFGRDYIKDYHVVDAAKTANVHRFIRTLPDGYDTVLGQDADTVSQGQRQLLTIARVVASDPRITILDEATSSVDTRLEVLIQKAMKNVVEGRTSFVIAHRLSTIRDADLILVMDHGTIVEQGTHSELLELNGLYSELYNSQFAR